MNTLTNKERDFIIKTNEYRGYKRERHSMLFVRHVSNGYVMRSYQTDISFYNADAKMLEIEYGFWNYSNTTRRHISNFLNDYVGISYPDVKSCAKGKRIHGELTGEIEFIDGIIINFVDAM